MQFSHELDATPLKFDNLLFGSVSIIVKNRMTCLPYAFWCFLDWLKFCRKKEKIFVNNNTHTDQKKFDTKKERNQCVINVHFLVNRLLLFEQSQMTTIMPKRNSSTECIMLLVFVFSFLLLITDSQSTKYSIALYSVYRKNS